MAKEKKQNENSFEVKRDVINIPDVVNIIEDNNYEKSANLELRIYEETDNRISPFQYDDISVIDRLPINHVNSINYESEVLTAGGSIVIEFPWANDGESEFFE